MTEAKISRVRPGLATCGLFLLAAASAGCTSGEYGSVPATPKASPDVAQVSPSNKGNPAPRVPRGPDQAKALQEAKAR